MKKILSLALILMTLLSLAGCAQVKQANPGGLSVKDPTVILGGKPPVQKVTYHLTLYNGGKQKVHVDSVRPVVDRAFAAMMGKNQELTVTVNKDLPAGESMEVSGKFSLKTNGIPKEQLVQMGKVVKSFTVASRASFDAPELQAETASEDNAQQPEQPVKAKKATPAAKP